MTTHTHLHSQYSFLDSTIRIDDLMPHVATQGHDAVALTDHGHLHGALHFWRAAREHDVKPILGMEAYVTHNVEERVRKHTKHFVLLARNQTGWENLVRLSTKAFEHSHYVPRLDWALIHEHSDGIIGTTACLGGGVAGPLRDDKQSEARIWIEEARAALNPDHFFLECQTHDEHPNESIISLADELRLPLVTTSDCHYLRPDGHNARATLVAIRLRKTLGELAKEDVPLYVKSPREIAEWWGADIGRFTDLAEMCEPPDLGRTAWRLPEAIQWPRLQTDYVERLEHELAIIEAKGYVGYFLAVADYVNWARQQGIAVGPGRGSGAGSLVAYLLGITSVDPVRHGLIFERFLNPERDSLPDFDIDFEQARRGEVVEYVRARYPDVAQISTFAEMRCKSVFKDVARVQGMDFKSSNRLTKMLPQWWEDELGNKHPMTLDKAMENPTFARAAPVEVVRIAQQLEGLPRQAGIHAAGVVMYAHDVPMTADGTTQWNMHDDEAYGLVKFDFLGLKTLDVIANTGISIPDTLDDVAVYKFLGTGATLGVFQVESTGMQRLLRELQPDRFEDIVAAVALYRPGPMKSGMMRDFVARKRGEKPVKYLHPLLEESLADTYGVIVYQEQVMDAARILAGYSYGEADMLRRAMGKKKTEAMQHEKQRWLSGCEVNGINERQAKTIWSSIEKFAGYGFNKSHSVAYAMLTYQTAWLKLYHPTEFMAALLSTEYKDMDKMREYGREALRLGIKLLPASLNVSEGDFSKVGNREIRTGLRALKGVGDKAVEAILAARKKGRFESWEDFLTKVNKTKVNKRVQETLKSQCECIQ